jgi:hypothetical protein
VDIAQKYLYSLISVEHSHRLKPKQKHYLSEDAMLMWRAYVCAGLLGFPCVASAMKSLLHKIDKEYGDQISYITNAESVELCAKVLRFNPDSDEGKKFTWDNDCLKSVHRVFEREDKLCTVIEKAVKEKDLSATIENIIPKIPDELCSPHLNIIMQCYIDKNLEKAAENISVLRKYSDVEKKPAALSPKDGTTDDIKDDTTKNTKNGTAIAAQKQTEAFCMTQEALEELILKANKTWAGAFLNVMRKNFIDTIGYLTDHKSETISKAVFAFKDHSLEFNPQLDLHQVLVYNALERERYLIWAIKGALNNNHCDDIRKISERVNNGYFSPVARAIVNGYLTTTSNNKVKELDHKDKKPKDNDQIKEMFTCEVHESQIPNLCKTVSEFDKDKLLNITHEVTAGKDNLKKMTFQIIAKRSESNSSLISALTKTLTLLAEKSKDPVDNQEKLKNNENNLKESQNGKAKSAASDHALNETQFLDINGKKVVQS